MRYYIRQHRKFVSGPHRVEDIRVWVREGKVREEMEFSEDGVTWMLGLEMVDLFPADRPRRADRRGPRTRS
jgi:hypothetical protein